MQQEYAHLELSATVNLAVPMEYVEETIAIAWAEICPIPGVPDGVLGVIDRGGKLLWVVELADFLSDILGLSAIARSHGDELTVGILCNSPREEKRQGDDRPPLVRQVGIAIGAFRGTLSVNPDEFQPIPPQWAPAIASLISQVAWVNPPNSPRMFPLGVLDIPAFFHALNPQ
ncbi:chemotaxis protein CheW [Phormidium sp. CCY1219]|uniref:chemotaxis protein CheW n=1 Tax=Phormidium sp. CCY1219 TaxID=2886104 RepID=UPI002D1F4EEC|nr:chemotaxis protein CheW [Phormidium sp. CCY1219]MEB3830226.1 chemotaxis protein CheW [Phormidium sp. CCY1219]